MTVASDKNKMPDSVAELLEAEATKELEAQVHMGNTMATAVVAFYKGVKDGGVPPGGCMALTHAFAAWLFAPDEEEWVEEEES